MNIRNSEINFDTFLIILNENQIFLFIDFYINIIKNGDIYWNKTYKNIKIRPKDKILLEDIKSRYDLEIDKNGLKSDKFIEKTFSVDDDIKYFFYNDLSKVEITEFHSFFNRLRDFDKQIFLSKVDGFKWETIIEGYENELIKSNSSNLIYFDPYILKNIEQCFKTVDNIRLNVLNCELKHRTLVYNRENSKKEIKYPDEKKHNENEKVEMKTKNKEIYKHDREDLEKRFDGFEIFNSPNFHDRFMIFNNLVFQFYGGTDISEKFDKNKSTGFRIYIPFLPNQLEYINKQLIYIRKKLFQ